MASLSASGGWRLLGNVCDNGTSKCKSAASMLERDVLQLLRSDELVTDSLKYTVKGTSGIPVRATSLSTTTV